MLTAPKKIIDGAANGPKFNLFRATLDNDRKEDWGGEVDWVKDGYNNLTYALKDFSAKKINDKSAQVTASIEASAASGYKVRTAL
ncbi:MAG TPA: hypothetical protein VHP30_11450, partial [Ignavibacteriales bacterium]|nr:hypothetical protein [Ignavibacteriales bacterium]